MNDYFVPIVEALTEDEVDRLAGILVEDLGIDPILAERWVLYADSACMFLGQEEAWAMAQAATPSAARRAWDGDAEQRRGFQHAAGEMLKHWHRMGRPGQLAFSAATSKHVAGYVPGFKQAAQGPQQEVANLLHGYPVSVLPRIEAMLTVLADVAGSKSTHQAIRDLPTKATLRRNSQILFLAALIEHLALDDIPDDDGDGKVAELCRVVLGAHNRARKWDKRISFKRLYKEAMQAANIA